MCVWIVSASCLQPKDWSISMNKKERRLALATALQSAAGDVVVVDDIKQAAGGEQMLRGW
jgi:ribosomal protein L4